MSNIEDSYFGSLPPGTVIGDYEVEGELGEGGMGMVFRARHARLGHIVALKVLAPQLARNQTLVRRFEQEARVQANLKHPNIVRCHDFISHERLCAMVMEYVDGEPLDEVIGQTGPMPEERIREVMLPVLDALDFAHNQGVVHRDLKPSNIMLAREAGREVPKVMDFGIAKLLEDGDMATATGSKLGTLRYMAPEQCTSSRDVDERSDVYALGITLYQMAAGRVPFDRGTDFELMKDHLETAPPSPRDVYPGVSGALEAVILTALEKDPNRRFQSAAEFKEALASGEARPAQAPAAPAARERSGVAPAPTIVETEEPPPAENRCVQAAPAGSGGRSSVPLLALAVLVLGLGGGGVAILAGRGEEATSGQPQAPKEEPSKVSKPAPKKDEAAALSPAARADLDRAEEHLKADRHADALSALHDARRLHGESGRRLALLLRYYLAQSGMWASMNTYHAKLPRSQAAMVQVKQILDKLRGRLRSLSALELYYVAHGYLFHCMLNADDAACAVGAAVARDALKKGLSDHKHVAPIHAALGMLQAFLGETDAGDSSLLRSIKEREVQGDKPMTFCAAAWNLAAVPLWGAQGRGLRRAMRQAHDRYARYRGQAWYPRRCPREPGGLAFTSYVAACRRKGCMQRPVELKVFFRGWANLVYGKRADGKRLLRKYLDQGGGTFTREARELHQEAVSDPGTGDEATTYLAASHGHMAPRAGSNSKGRQARVRGCDGERTRCDKRCGKQCTHRFGNCSMICAMKCEEKYKKCLRRRSM